MDCDEFKKLAETLIFEREGTAWPSQLAQHFDQCSGCRKEMQADQRSWQLLGELPETEPAPDYFERFQQRLSRRTPWYQAVLEGIRNAVAPRWAVPAYAAALAAVVVITLVGLNGRYSSRPDAMFSTTGEVEIELLANLDLIEEFEVIHALDLLADIEIIEKFNGAS